MTDAGGDIPGRGKRIRDDRLHSVFGRELSQIIRHLSDPKLEGLDLFSVEVAADLSRVRIVCVPTLELAYSKKAIQTALEKAAPFIRHSLAESLSLKKTPVVALRYAPELTIIPGSKNASPNDAER